MKTYKIGRNLDNDIIIQDDTLTVSRYHATLNVNNTGSITIIDNSTNGTFINGTKVQKGVETYLIKGDDVKFGKSCSLDWTKIDIPTSNSFTRVENVQSPKIEVQGMFINSFIIYGRIRSLEYGLSNLIYAVIAIFLNYTFEKNESLIVIYLAFIPLVWFLIAQGAKRCHDLGNSGWYQLIPFYGLWLLFADSNTGSNEYGRNPKGIN